MLSSILAIIVILVAGLLLSIVIVVALDRLRSRGTNGSIAAEYDRYYLRLGAPQFDAISSLFKCDLPEGIILLYTSKQEVTRREFEVVRPSGREPIFISHYLPCDPEAIADCYDDCEDLLSFATDGGDLTYAIDPRIGNPPVMGYDAETGSLETVAETLGEFMAWPRRSAFTEGNWPRDE